MGGQCSMVPEVEPNQTVIVVQGADDAVEQQRPTNTWHNQPGYAAPIGPPPRYGAPADHRQYGYPYGAAPYTPSPVQAQNWSTGQQLQQPFYGYQQQVPYGYSPTGPVQYRNQNYYGQIPPCSGYPAQAYYQPGQSAFYGPGTVTNQDQLQHSPNCQVGVTGVCVCPKVIVAQPSAEPSTPVQVQNTQPTADEIVEKVWKKLEQRTSNAKENSNNKPTTSQMQFTTKPDDIAQDVNLPNQANSEWTLDNIKLPNNIKTVSQIEPNRKNKPVALETVKVLPGDDYHNSFAGIESAKEATSAFTSQHGPTTKSEFRKPLGSKKSSAKSTNASEIPSSTEHSKAQFTTIMPTNIKSSDKKKKHKKYVKPMTSSFFALPQSDTKIATSIENDGAISSSVTGSSKNSDNQKSSVSRKKKKKNKSACSIKSTKSRKSLKSRKSISSKKSRKSNKVSKSKPVNLDDVAKSSTIGSGVGSKSLTELIDKKQSISGSTQSPKADNKKKKKNKSACSIKSTKSRKSLKSRKSISSRKSRKSNKVSKSKPVNLDDVAKSSTIGSGVGSKSLTELIDKKQNISDSTQSPKSAPDECKCNVSEADKPVLALSENGPTINDRSLSDSNTTDKTEEFDTKRSSSSSPSELMQNSANKSVQPTMSIITPEAENYKPLFECSSVSSPDLLLRNVDKNRIGNNVKMSKDIPEIDNEHSAIKLTTALETNEDEKSKDSPLANDSPKSDNPIGSLSPMSSGTSEKLNKSNRNKQETLNEGSKKRVKTSSEDKSNKELLRAQALSESASVLTDHPIMNTTTSDKVQSPEQLDIKNKSELMDSLDFDSKNSSLTSTLSVNTSEVEDQEGPTESRKKSTSVSSQSSQSSLSSASSKQKKTSSDEQNVKHEQRKRKKSDEEEAKWKLEKSTKQKKDDTKLKKKDK